MVVLPNLGSRSRGIDSLWLIRLGQPKIGIEGGEYEAAASVRLHDLRSGGPSE
ncbi:hypothetical protein FB390_5201 [Nocardia bhagyanarayanae]|uniref:Uncharacterized protein n=1 Tax=Nocardia bhagyanarayanae TaxID=1215925 RepID=A0A543FI07_9NOCA|nr:hypothetical protein FB390_5201 [Nocardia bhagyanarayanae]